MSFTLIICFPSMCISVWHAASSAVKSFFYYFFYLHNHRRVLCVRRQTLTCVLSRWILHLHSKTSLKKVPHFRFMSVHVHHLHLQNNGQVISQGWNDCHWLINISCFLKRLTCLAQTGCRKKTTNIVKVKHVPQSSVEPRWMRLHSWHWSAGATPSFFFFLNLLSRQI